MRLNRKCGPMLAGVLILVVVLTFMVGVANGQFSRTFVENLGVLPNFVLNDKTGTAMNSLEFASGTTIITFVKDDSVACERFLFELGVLETKSFFSELEFIIIVSSITDTILEKLATVLPRAMVLEDPDYEVADMFGVVYAPSIYVFHDGLYYGQMPWYISSGEIQANIEQLSPGELSSTCSSESLIKSGDSMPVIRAKDDSDTYVTIDRFEKPTVLIFSSIYCYSCIEEMELIPNLDSQDINFLVVLRESHREVLESGLEWSLNILYDEDGWVFDDFRMRVTPTYIIVYQDQIIDIISGKVPIDILKQRIEALYDN